MCDLQQSHGKEIPQLPSEAWRCHHCGEVLDEWSYYEDIHIQKYLGYGSRYDGKELRMQLCCDCLDNYIEECKLSPLSGEYSAGSIKPIIRGKFGGQ